MKRCLIAITVAVWLVAGLSANSGFGAPLSDPTESASAQKPKPNKQDDRPQIGVLTVRLPISVKKKDHLVDGLAQGNFEVFEDNKLQKIEGFQAPSHLPLSVAVLMDTSESVKLKLPFEKDAAEDFVATVTTYRRKDQILFLTFDNDIELHQDFTDDEQRLIQEIKKVKAGGYTRMYDAVCRVVEEKMTTISGADRRAVIVILTDGSDTASDHSLKDAIEMAQKYDVTIFGISTKNFTGITSGTVEGADDKELRRLCEETGGQLFLPSEKKELFSAFSKVAEDLRQEYVLFYTPDNQDKAGKRRSIRVKLVHADGHLFYKQGYVY